MDEEACKKRRPPISHTKSNTRIMYWASGHGFQQDSPPHIDPPQGPPNAMRHVEPSPLDGVTSSNASSDSNPTLAYHKPHKKRHISFNTFVEQYIAIKKPKKGAVVSRSDDGDGEDDDDEDGGVPLCPGQEVEAVRTPRDEFRSGRVGAFSDSPNKARIVEKPSIASMSSISTFAFGGERMIKAR